MIDRVRVCAVAMSCLVWLGVAGSAVTLLSSCTTVKSTPGVNSDLITESDEPESRKRARLRLELAIAYFDKGQTTDALDHLKQSIAADPNMFEAYNMRGLIYMRLNDMALAEDSFKKALAVNPNAASVQHNYGWMLCQQSRMAEATQLFDAAVANPAYGDRPKTWMAQGLCQQRAGQLALAEASFMRAYEFDAANPITGYNLALLMFQRSELIRAQFYIRKINNSEWANAETLWLGIKIERRLENRDTVQQLAGQLKKRFAQSREYASFERGAFNE